VLEPVATVELVWQDASGDRAVTAYRVPSSYTVEQAFSAGQSVVDACSALTDAALVGMRVRYKFNEDERTSAAGSTPITSTGVFFFSTGPSTPDTGIVIHALKPSILMADGPLAGVGVDLSNTDVLAFRDVVLGLPGCNPFGDEVITLFAAYLQSRV
jgi:hypothetical protein